MGMLIGIMAAKYMFIKLLPSFSKWCLTWRLPVLRGFIAQRPVDRRVRACAPL